jgi:hypothetical protein
MFNRIRKDTEKTTVTLLSFTSSISDDQTIPHRDSNLSKLEATPKRESLTPKAPKNEQPSTSQLNLLVPEITPAVKINNPPPTSDTHSVLKIVFRHNDYYSAFSLYELAPDGNTIAPFSANDPNPQKTILEFIAKHKGEEKKESGQRKHQKVRDLMQTTLSSQPPSFPKAPKIKDVSHKILQFPETEEAYLRDLPKNAKYTLVTVKFSTEASRTLNPVQRLFNKGETFSGNHRVYALCDKCNRKLFLVSKEENEPIKSMIEEFAPDPTLNETSIFR